MQAAPLPIWERSPSAVCRADRREAAPQSVCWHGATLQRLLRAFASSQVPRSLPRQSKSPGLRTKRNKTKKKTKKKKNPNKSFIIFFSSPTRTPPDVIETREGKGEQTKNRRDMGAFRLLLGSLHYMGLYMQLSVSTRQAGHGEIENHISGNGRCEVRSTSPPSVIHLLLLLPLLLFFLQFILIYSFLVVDEGTPEGLCGV